MITINTVLFIFICIFSVIGALVFLLGIIFVAAIVIGGIVETIEESREVRKHKND